MVPGEPPNLINTDMGTLLSPKPHTTIEQALDDNMVPNCRLNRRKDRGLLGLEEHLSAVPLKVGRAPTANGEGPAVKRIRKTETTADTHNPSKVWSTRTFTDTVSNYAVKEEDALGTCTDTFHIADLPDEIWFRFYSFLHTKAHWESLSFNELFRSMSSVSKEGNGRLMRYVQQVPQDFTYEEDNGNLDALLWACRNQIKLGKVDFRSCDSCFEFNLCLLMLRRCNITDMHILKIKTFWLANDEFKNMGIAQKVIEAGIPADEILKPMSPFDFQRELASCVQKRSRALRKVAVLCKHNEIYIPFFTNFSQTLVDVTLKLFEGIDANRSSGNDLQAFTNVVTNMPKLKKLKINACLTASISVKSDSLTKIDVRSSLGGFLIDECICPSLGLFRSSYFVKDSSWNGVRPVARIDVQEELEKKYAEDKRVIDMQVRSNPFLGMHVPDSCIVRLYLQKKNFL
jgi:hypothetical protein